MSERDKFLADIIAELNRQATEDQQSFSGVLAFSDSEVFIKLRFDFPLVSDDDLLVLHSSLDSSLRNLKGGLLFSEDFTLHHKFVENVLHFCSVGSTSSSGAPTTTSADNTKLPTGGSSPASGKNCFLLAAWMFLKLPGYLLSCRGARLRTLFRGLGGPRGALERLTADTDIHHVFNDDDSSNEFVTAVGAVTATAADSAVDSSEAVLAPPCGDCETVIMQLHSYVLLGTVSIIAAHTSDAATQATPGTAVDASAVNVAAKQLQDSDYLASLAEAIDSLRSFLTEAEGLLAEENDKIDVNNAETGRGASNGPKGRPAWELDGVLQAILATKGTQSKLDIADLSVRNMCETVLSYCAATPVGASGEESDASGDTDLLQLRRRAVGQLSGLVQVVKPMFMHWVFLYRDLLIQFPVLVVGKSASLWNALVPATSGASVAAPVVVSFGRGVGTQFPTSAECLYVLCFASLASYATASSSSTSSGGSKGLSLQVAKAALRKYMFAAPGSLAKYMDLCHRMLPHQQTPVDPERSFRVFSDIEVTGFIIDVAMLGLNDLVKSAPAAAAASCENLWISSQLLPTLLTTFVNATKSMNSHHQQQQQGLRPVAPAEVALFSRYDDILFYL
jgi:hypothetical protein